MVGIEAMSSGFCIAHPALGWKSLCPMPDIPQQGDYGAWEEAIRKLDDPAEYKKQSNCA